MPPSLHNVEKGPLQDAWHLLELATIHHPDALAVVDAASRERQLTYQQLYERSTALAGYLRQQGVGRGDRIGVLSRNCSYVVELHFATAAIHAVVVNLNIHLAPRELSFIFKDSSPQLVFADRQYAGSLLAAVEGQHGLGDSVGAAAFTVVWMDIEPNSAPTADTAGVGVSAYG